MAGKIKIKQVRSGIGRPQKQRETLKGLGLGKIGRVRELVDTPEVQGMVRKVSHLVELVD